MSRLQTDSANWFPIRRGQPYAAIGFAVVAARRSYFEFDHGLTLEELRAQGGLDWIELWCGFTGTPLFPSPKVTAEAARLYVLNHVIEHALKPGARGATPGV